MPPPRHLYVHVPFCGRRCVYCDFSIAVRGVTPVNDYLGALRAELLANVAAAPIRLDTLYLGGGTPSRLGGAGIRAISDLVREYSSISEDCEFTIEANPEDVNPTDADVWARAGVNRVSLGVQSFDNAALTWMHRSHTAADSIQAVRTLRASGIENISVDLIFALPAALDRAWRDDLEKAISLDTPHVSVYGLTVEPLTPLAKWVNAGSVRSGEEEPYAEEFLEAHSLLTAAGFDHYEVSNYARDGMVSRHNSAYWSGVDYLGLGPSAHSLVGGRRRWNVRAYERWKSCVLSGATAVDGSENLDDEARGIESIYLGLRTNRGFRPQPEDNERVHRWLEAGWGTMDKGILTLNASGWLRLDALAADLAGTAVGRNYISGYGSPAA